MEETTPKMDKIVPGQVKEIFESLTHRTFYERTIGPDEWHAIDAQPPSQIADSLVMPISDVYAYEETGSSRLEDPVLKHVWTYSMFATPNRVIVTLYQGNLLPLLETSLQRTAYATGTQFMIHVVMGGSVRVTHGIWPKSASRKHLRLALPP